jgi:hypothetical protein
MTDADDIGSQKIGCLLDMTGHHHRIIGLGGSLCRDPVLKDFAEMAARTYEGGGKRMFDRHSGPFFFQAGAKVSSRSSVETMLPLIQPLDIVIIYKCGRSIHPFQDLHRVGIHFFGIERSQIGLC